MKISKYVLLATLLATAACGGGSNDKPDGSTEGGTDGSKKDAAPTSDAGTDGGASATIDPACTVPGTSPSGGSCVPIDDAGVFCNPITNGGCDSDAGEACDIDPNGDLGCFPPPPPNTAALCAACDDNTIACAPGSTCLPATNAPDAGSECAHFCCTDADCGNGHCDKTTFNSDPLGFCVK